MPNPQYRTALVASAERRVQGMEIPLAALKHN